MSETHFDKGFRARMPPNSTFTGVNTVNHVDLLHALVVKRINSIPNEA